MKRLGIIGAGLIGASLTKFWARTSVSLTIVEKDAALHKDLEDIAPHAEVTDRFVEGLSECELIVVAVPLGALQSVFTTLKPILNPGQLVIDVAGVKTNAERIARESIGLDSFIGCHPMAGHAGGGLNASRADLFLDARVACCNPAKGNLKQQLLVSEFWESQGAIPMWMSAQHHDTQVAWTSHLPYALSALLMNHLEDIPNELIGPGFLRSTRYADFSTDVMGEVISKNPAMVDSLKEFTRRLERFTQALEGQQPEALESLERAHLLRQKLLKSES